jgi:N-acetylmuramoyl-L-alanine amidase
MNRIMRYFSSRFFLARWAVLILFIALCLPSAASAVTNSDSLFIPQDERAKWKFDCIIIDPGHGGRDPGTIGVNGTKEKDIALSIALKLGDIIKKYMPEVKVVYTRKTDKFVELYKRGKIANESGGKLFISIHCNALKKKPSAHRGFEVYLLRPGRTDEAIRISEVENSVIKFEKGYKDRYKELDAEQFIILNMAQSAYAKHSQQFASYLHEEIEKGEKIKSSGIKQAGFYVLVGASMPAVLVETEYLSNKKAEEFLISNKGQSHMAYSLYYAINKFAKYYAKTLK